MAKTQFDQREIDGLVKKAHGMILGMPLDKVVSMIPVKHLGSRESLEKHIRETVVMVLEKDYGVKTEAERA